MEVSVENGWEPSADAWIANMSEYGDFARRYVLDPIMLVRALSRMPKKVLDVGCGEGRFCRMLKPHGLDVNGIDPTPTLIAAAHHRDADTGYLQAGQRLYYPVDKLSRRTLAVDRVPRDPNRE
jgi:2-polyprenyl-3-methyl-5-hydroxy-6-metoxy-1,4-benzoquinol methylase